MEPLILAYASGAAAAALNTELGQSVYTFILNPEVRFQSKLPTSHQLQINVRKHVKSIHLRYRSIFPDSILYIFLKIYPICEILPHFLNKA